MMLVLANATIYFHDAALLAAMAVAAPFLFVLRRVLFCRCVPASSSPQREAPGSAAARPAPPYLAPCADDDALIGGSAIHLSPPRGPAGATLSFRAFAAPSFEGEIPKVDVYGTVNFVRTGRIRTFVRRGALRLLVVDVREMTLAIHAPKQAKKKMKQKVHVGMDPPSPKQLFSDDGTAASPARKYQRRASGINISITANNRPGGEDAEAEDDDPGNAESVELGDVAWNPRQFELAQVYRLDDVVSVAAVPPRHGGVVEIMSRVGTLPGPFEEPEKKSKGKKERPQAALKTPQSLQMTEMREEASRSSETVRLRSARGSLADIEHGHGRDAASSKKKKSWAATENHRDEFTFCTPCDAAEFQRVILALRTLGKEIACIYETLEVHSEVHPNKMVDMFSPPGVPFVNAWHCFCEIPCLRKGLYQMCILKEGLNGIFQSPNRNQNAIADADEEWPHAQRSIGLGLVDLFSLFVPPLAPRDSRAVPFFTPCAANESTMFGGDMTPNQGIEWHYERLSFVSALQRRVVRAALYVRVFAWAYVISHHGWHLNKPRLDEKEKGGDRQPSDDASSSDKSQNVNDVQITNVSEGVSAENSPVTSTLATSHQGYSCVGYFVFSDWIKGPRLPGRPFRRHGFYGSMASHTSNGQPLNPFCFIPSLQSVVNKFPHSHFKVFSYCSETGIALYFLLVRSLPVGLVGLGADQTFDSCETTPNTSWTGTNGECTRFLQNSGYTVCPSSFRAVLIALARVLKCYPRKEKSQMLLLSEFLTPTSAFLWHHGDSLENSIILNNVPIYQVLGEAAVRSFLSDMDTLGIVKTRSVNLIPEGVVSLTIANVFKEAPGVKSEEDIMRASEDDNLEDKVEMEITEEDFSEEMTQRIDTIYDILSHDCMRVPIRRRDRTRGEHDRDNCGEIIRLEPVDTLLTRADIRRFLIACENELLKSITRLVEFAAWRGIMFPIDERLCRVELQSAQFFQQGYDKNKNPIFYLRTTLLGPWRNDIHATVISVLHRLETYFLEAAHKQSSVKITLIVFLDQAGIASNPTSIVSDPRIDSHEEYCTHANAALLQILHELIPRHYPGRLGNTLFVTSKSRSTWLEWKSIQSQFAQSRVAVLNSAEDLDKYVDKDELVLLAGGRAKVTSDAFECSELRQTYQEGLMSSQGKRTVTTNV